MARNAVVSLIIKGKDLTRGAWKSATSRAGRFKNAILSIRTAVIGMVAAVTAGIGIKLVKAFGRQEEAIIRVNSALRNAGKFSEEASERIQKAAADLQKLTTQGDEAILEGTAMVSELARDLDADQLVEAQKALIGLADTFFGGDLRSAAALMGKSIGSNVNALTRYGLQVDVTASQEEKLNQILEQSLPLFESSKAAAEGILGTMAQLSNAAGDVQEEFGAVIAETLNLRTTQGEATNELARFSEHLQENREQYVRWGRTYFAILKTLIGALRIVLNVFQAGGDALSRTFWQILTRFSETVNELVDLYNRARIRFGKEPIEFRLDTERFQAEADAALRSFRMQGSDISTAIDGIGESWHNVGAEVKEVVRAVRSYRAAAEEAAGVTAAPLGAALREADAIAQRELERRRRERMARDAERGRFSTFEVTPQAPAPPPGPGPTGDSITGFREGFGRAIHDALGATESLDGVLVRMTDRTLTGFGSASSDAFAAMADGSKSAGEAFEAAMMGALAAVASGFGEFFLARATAALGQGLLGDPKGFAAAAKYVAAATAMFALSGTLGAAASGGGGGSRASASSRTRDVSGSGGEAIVYLEGDFYLDSSNPRSVDRFSRMLEDVSGRRVTIRRTGR